MAMDKEMLLQRLQSQYLTRQEVLFKLPLNISISTFWPELVERRKMNSVVLPLHRADGKPMWYVLTDKMIAASERLCALALDCDLAIDPYKTAMTGAMTEEIFFTSFVEGAQITLQEAMEFLERGTEPENVQEQMIQNIANGMVAKFYKESCLLEQAYIDDNKISVAQYLKNIDKDLTVTEFKRFTLRAE